MNSDISQVKVENFVNPVIIGEGTYATVYKAYDRITERYVSLKKICLEDESEGIPHTTIREISLLKCLDHPNIVLLLDVVCYDANIYLVFEYMVKDLKCLLEDNPLGLSAPQAKSYLRQLLLGLVYCHDKHVLHRDLKPENLLVDNRGNIKLADFGLARHVSLPMKAYSHQIVTLYYRAPEILLGVKIYSPAVDIWSLGCIFIEMLIGKVLFPGKSEIGQILTIFKTLGTPNEECWPGVGELPGFNTTFPTYNRQDLSSSFPQLNAGELDLTMKMLIYYPESRISAQEALEHGYFNDAIDFLRL